MNGKHFSLYMATPTKPRKVSMETLGQNTPNTVHKAWHVHPTVETVGHLDYCSSRVPMMAHSL